LDKKPKKPIIIGGFPSYGLVGTITTDFLIKHLNAKPIGRIKSDKLMPVVALHEAKIINPLGIFYDEKSNIVIVHALSMLNGLEWKLAESMVNLCKQLNAKELILIEGVASNDPNLNTYYYSNKNANKFNKIKVKELKDGIIMGVTGVLLIEAKDIPVSCIFAESHVSFADSEAAAKIIEVLDKYLGLRVDFKPLLETAKKFEGKLKLLMKKMQKPAMGKEQKEELSYLG